MLRIMKLKAFRLEALRLKPFKIIKLNFLCLILTISLCFLSSSFVIAQTNSEAEETTAQLIQSLESVLKITTFVEANNRFCFDYAEETVPTLQLATNQWRLEHNIENLMIVIDVMNQSYNGSITQVKSDFYVENLELLEARAISQAANWCQQFPQLLRSEEMDLRNNFATELETLSNFAETYFNIQPDKHRTINLPRQNLEAVSNPSYKEFRAAGIHPSYNIIPTEFHCYAERSRTAYAVPDFVLQASAEGTYQSSFGGGSYAPLLEEGETRSYKVTWTGVLGEVSSSTINFNNQGQTIKFKELNLDNQIYDYECYQQGPRAEAAMVHYQLRDPQVGLYTCLDTDETIEQPPIEFLKGRRYRIGTEEGHYSVNISNDYNDSDIVFITGPLEGLETSYYEEFATGIRKFSFTEFKSYFPTFNSTSSLKMTCSAKGEGLTYAEYSDEAAPTPPAGSGGLSGLYSKSIDSRTTHGTGRSNFEFYYFTPEGHALTSEPNLLTKVKCHLTTASGAPSCVTYTVQGNEIKFQREGEYHSKADLSDLKTVNTGITSLEGKFLANAGETIGICGEFSYCRSWYEEKVIHLTKDGHFLLGGKSQSLASFSTGFGSTDTGAYSNSSDAGTYTISGNEIELRFNDGTIARNFIAVFSEERIHMSGWTYFLWDDE